MPSRVRLAVKRWVERQKEVRDRIAKRRLDIERWLRLGPSAIKFREQIKADADARTARILEAKRRLMEL